MSETVTIFTRVYNTKPYLEQCVESVLAQTHRDFEYILFDNGCTDGSSELMRRFAERDRRIRLMRNEVNTSIDLFGTIIKYGVGSYCAALDSDDWWEPDYLERLLRFMKNERLDFAATGTVKYLESAKTSSILRKLDKPVILTLREFARDYPRYWTFPSTFWGGLMRTEVLRRVDTESLFKRKNIYGGDTLSMLGYIGQCERIGIDDSALYHYRVHRTSVSYKYNSRRFAANVDRYLGMNEFLRGNDALSESNAQFLLYAYATEISDTVDVIQNAALAPGEKLCEYRRIAEHPLTQAAYQHDHHTVRRSRKALLTAALDCAAASEPAREEDLRAVVKALAPACEPAAALANAPLFAREPRLLEAMLNDDAEALLTALLDLIRAQKYTKQYDLCAMVCALSEAPPLKSIDDRRFLRHYGDIYLAVWRGQYAEALDQMTGMLLGGEKSDETFLQLYLSLAALLGQAAAFIFGKTRLAALRLRQGDKEACRALLDELEEMGAGETEEVSALRRKWEE